MIINKNIDMDKKDLFHQMNSELAVVYGYLQLLQDQPINDVNIKNWVNKALISCNSLKNTLEKAAIKYKEE